MVRAYEASLCMPALSGGTVARNMLTDSPAYRTPVSATDLHNRPHHSDLRAGNRQRHPTNCPDKLLTTPEVLSTQYTHYMNLYPFLGQR